MKKTILLLFIVNFSLKAQDLVLNQFGQNPLTLGPQLGSSVKEQVNLGAHIWGIDKNASLYEQYFVTFNKYLVSKPDQIISIHPVFNLERAGESRFSNQTIGIGLSTAMPLFHSGKMKHSLGAGLQPSIVRRAIDERDLRWPSQIGPGGFDPAEPGEVVSNFVYLDLAAGLNYKIEFDSQQVMVGYKMGHINRAKISTLNPQNFYRQERSHTLYALAQINISQKLSLKPRMLYHKIGVQNNWTTGFDISTPIGKKIVLTAGGGKMKNGIFVNAGMEIGKWQWLVLREKYDGNLYDGWEFALNYKI